MNAALQLTSNNLLELRDICVGYGQQVVINKVSLNIEKGEIGCLLGPSGCGKSTLLRAIAGFEPVRQGVIQLCTKTISETHNTLAPEHRNIGMVFQDVALFPHLSIEQNVAFGIKKLAAAQRKERVQQLLHLVGLSDSAKRYPHELSGGQQQRIALARALAPKPKLILLDEPFSGLDAKLRETLVPQVRDILKQEQVSALMVSHDQAEAFAIADKIAVMHKGEIHQWDNAYNSYHRPATKFVASFIGKSKFLTATTLCEHCIETPLGKLESKSPHGYTAGEKVEVLIRLDDVEHDPSAPHFGTVTQKNFHGSYFTYEITLADGSQLLCSTPAHYSFKHDIGDQFNIKLSMEHLVLFTR
ncbi:MAG: ABC transporter ATP-binding protein [Pseudomonadales bacterium]|nr:ABC transporter ATP-binding protein [Pseudomonadales bacterium]NRA16348.1 ABC transporter ATP-binding protein [Oceanospirillaceae bacterium]